MKKKTLKIIALITAFILIIGLSWFANALLGNPISKMLATNTAKKHLAETYRNENIKRLCRKLFLRNKK